MLHLQLAFRKHVVHSLGQHHAERAHIHPLSRRRMLVDELNHLRHKHRIGQPLRLVVDVGAYRPYADFILYSSVDFQQSLAAGHVDIRAGVLAKYLYRLFHPVAYFKHICNTAPPPFGF